MNMNLEIGLLMNTIKQIELLKQIDNLKLQVNAYELLKKNLEYIESVLNSNKIPFKTTSYPDKIVFWMHDKVLVVGNVIELSYMNFEFHRYNSTEEALNDIIIKDPKLIRQAKEALFQTRTRLIEKLKMNEIFATEVNDYRIKFLITENSGCEIIVSEEITAELIGFDFSKMFEEWDPLEMVCRIYFRDNNHIIGYKNIFPFCPELIFETEDNLKKESLKDKLERQNCYLDVWNRFEKSCDEVVQFIREIMPNKKRLLKKSIEKTIEDVAHIFLET